MHKRGRQAKHWVSYFIKRPKQQPTLMAPLPGRHTPTHISGSTSLSSKSQDPISQKESELKESPPLPFLEGGQPSEGKAGASPGKVQVPAPAFGSLTCPSEPLWELTQF